MTTRTFASLVAATLILSSASAFAASAPSTTAAPAPAAQMEGTTTAAAAPAQHPVKVASSSQTKQKSCEKQFTIEQKAGKLNNVGHKDFVAKCLKGA